MKNNLPSIMVVFEVSDTGSVDSPELPTSLSTFKACLNEVKKELPAANCLLN